MTQQHALKENIRNRMSETGEGYLIAKQKVEETQGKELEVIELGEDGGLWFVQNALNLQDAQNALDLWIEETIGEDDIFLEEYKEIKESISGVVHYDWFWKPVNPTYPDDEAYLYRKGKNITEYSNEELFTGILLQE